MYQIYFVHSMVDAHMKIIMVFFQLRELTYTVLDHGGNPHVT